MLFTARILAHTRMSHALFVRTRAKSTCRMLGCSQQTKSKRIDSTRIVRRAKQTPRTITIHCECVCVCSFFFSNTRSFLHGESPARFSDPSSLSKKKKKKENSTSSGERYIYISQQLLHLPSHLTCFLSFFFLLLLLLSIFNSDSFFFVSLSFSFAIKIRFSSDFSLFSKHHLSLSLFLSFQKSIPTIEGVNNR